MSLHHDDVRLDLGERPSTQPSLQATVRVRPITIRFTEPGVRDLHLKLHSLTSLRPLHPQPPSRSPPTHTEQLIFDFDTEEQDHPPPPRPVPPLQDDQSAQHLVRDVVNALGQDGLMGDETVRALKVRMVTCREGVRGRRLRLIHAGRMLRDGVRLVGYLEELDMRTRAQSRQTLRHLALSNDHDLSRSDIRDVAGPGDESQEDSEEEKEAEEAEEGEQERDQVERREMNMRELVDWLSSQGEATGGTHEEEPSGSLDKVLQTTRKGKGKSREPSFYDDLIRLTVRTAPTVYIQCSVGDIETQPSPTSPSAPPTNPLIELEGAVRSTHDLHILADGTDPIESDESRNRGFNRLLEAGLTPDEISTIRTAFRTSHPLSTHYDLIQQREHAQHLLEMEESWMDTFINPSTTGPGEIGDFGEPAGSGAYTTVMQGLMVGFFLPPLIPLFWFREKPHPSSLPTNLAEGEVQDDEEEWERERLSLTRDSVFGRTMQISILFGLVANLIIGIFRFVW